MEEVPKFIEDGMEELEQLLVQQRIAFYKHTNVTAKDSDRILACARAEPGRWFPNFYGGGVVAYDDEGNLYYASTDRDERDKIYVGRCTGGYGYGAVVTLREFQSEVPGSWEYYGEQEILRMRRDNDYDWQQRRFITAWEKQTGIR